MCGLSIIVGENRENVGRTVRLALSSIWSRGPDSNGIVLKDLPDGRFLGLGHNRLSILDLSSHGAQPMTSSDGRYTLVYNGEVFNYLEIAKELTDKITDKEFGDTAVVLESLIKWGPRALNRFNGMWSLALYDSVQHTLLIARDRLGVKPLYYFESGPQIIIASEIKAILAASNRKWDINLQTVIPYLTRGLQDNTLSTYYKEIYQFPPAHYAILPLNRSTPIDRCLNKYWSHPYELGTAGIDDNVTPEEIAELFIDSVRIRLRSDVPIGLLLSGGVDSSSILGAIKKLGHVDNLTILSVISDDKTCSEEPYIDEMAKFVNCTPVKLNVSNSPHNLYEQIEEANIANDGPIGGLANIAHYNLMNIAKSRGIKVLLTGQGADEQLGGYKKFVYFYLMQLYRQHNYIELLGLVVKFSLFSNIFCETRVKEIYRYIRRSKVIESSFISNTYRSIDDVDIGPGKTYEQREWLDLAKFSLPSLLHSEDRMSMAHSIEMRVPFLDFRLVEMLARIPAYKKFAGDKPNLFFVRQ